MDWMGIPCARVVLAVALQELQLIPEYLQIYSNITKGEEGAGGVGWEDNWLVFWLYVKAVAA